MVRLKGWREEGEVRAEENEAEKNKTNKEEEMIKYKRRRKLKRGSSQCIEKYRLFLLIDISKHSSKCNHVYDYLTA
jgi:hypothetical protein